MKETVDLLTRYFEDEYRALFEKFGGSWEDSRAAGDALLAYLAAEVYPQGLGGRLDSDTSEEIARLATQRPRLAPRKLFVVRRYDDKALTTVFGGYASDASPYSDRTTLLAFVARDTSNALKVIAWYEGCLDCKTSGKIGGNSCPECNGKGWQFSGGSNLDRLLDVAPVETLKLMPPTRPGPWLDDYDKA